MDCMLVSMQKDRLEPLLQFVSYRPGALRINSHQNRFGAQKRLLNFHSARTTVSQQLLRIAATISMQMKAAHATSAGNKQMQPLSHDGGHPRSHSSVPHFYHPHPHYTLKYPRIAWQQDHLSFAQLYDVFLCLFLAKAKEIIRTFLGY